MIDMSEISNLSGQGFHLHFLLCVHSSGGRKLLLVVIQALKFSGIEVVLVALNIIH